MLKRKELVPLLQGLKVSLLYYLLESFFVGHIDSEVKISEYELVVMVLHYVVLVLKGAVEGFGEDLPQVALTACKLFLAAS